MLYIVSYDIESDSKRNKIFKKLKDYGERVQYSVFELNINNDEFDKLIEELNELLGIAENDNIRAYSLCSSCKVKNIVLGKSDKESVGKYEKKTIVV